MRIRAAEVEMQSSHSRTEIRSVEESFEVWDERMPSDRVSISVQIEVGLNVLPPNETPRKKEEGEFTDSNLTPADLIKRLILERMFSFRAEIAQVDRGASESAATIDASRAPPTQSRDSIEAGFGGEYHRREVHTVSEASKVAARGTVVTSDGKAIDFDYALNRSQQQVTVVDTQILFGKPKKVDPLAIDLDGNGVSLQSEKMQFDLNADGSTESISRLQGADAWLGIDRNGNGSIDDGSELFGPSSGSGFGELAALDSDLDGFMDEDDAAFEKLVLWQTSTPDAKLMSLKEAGVGAIGVMSVKSPYTLKGGAVAETGIYLAENGTPGAVEHVDLEV